MPVKEALLVYITEEEARHLIVALENALVAKNIVSASAAPDVRKVQTKVLIALGKRYGEEDG